MTSRPVPSGKTWRLPSAETATISATDQVPLVVVTKFAAAGFAGRSLRFLKRIPIRPLALAVHDVEIRVVDALQVVTDLIIALRLVEVADRRLQRGQLALGHVAERATSGRLHAHGLQLVDTDVAFDGLHQAG